MMVSLSRRKFSNHPATFLSTFLLLCMFLAHLSISHAKSHRHHHHSKASNPQSEVEDLGRESKAEDKENSDAEVSPEEKSNPDEASTNPEDPSPKLNNKKEEIANPNPSTRSKSALKARRKNKMLLQNLHHIHRGLTEQSEEASEQEQEKGTKEKSKSTSSEANVDEDERPAAETVKVEKNADAKIAGEKQSKPLGRSIFLPVKNEDQSFLQTEEPKTLESANDYEDTDENKNKENENLDQDKNSEEKTEEKIVTEEEKKIESPVVEEKSNPNPIPNSDSNPSPIPAPSLNPNPVPSESESESDSESSPLKEKSKNEKETKDKSITITQTKIPRITLQEFQNVPQSSEMKIVRAGFNPVKSTNEKNEQTGVTKIQLAATPSNPFLFSNLPPYVLLHQAMQVLRQLQLQHLISPLTRSLIYRQQKTIPLPFQINSEVKPTTKTTTTKQKETTSKKRIAMIFQILLKTLYKIANKNTNILTCKDETKIPSRVSEAGQRVIQAIFRNKGKVATLASLYWKTTGSLKEYSDFMVFTEFMEFLKEHLFAGRGLNFDSKGAMVRLPPSMEEVIAWGSINDVIQFLVKECDPSHFDLKNVHV